jgi:hypothetical protein
MCLLAIWARWVRLALRAASALAALIHNAETRMCKTTALLLARGL